MKIAILQSQIPHYREEFFKRFAEKYDTDMYVYQSESASQKGGFLIGKVGERHISCIEWKGFVLYNPFQLLHGYRLLILPLHFAHLTTWMLLMLKKLFGVKILLWGHGISVKRYLKEEHQPDWKLNLMINMSDGIWTYMEKEADQWRSIFPNKPITALYNTVSGAEGIVAYSEANKQLRMQEFKEKYNITQDIVFLFCARFEKGIRRTDLLEKIIQTLDPKTYGFVIIGAGSDKPDFSPYQNVYDFGAVYDTDKKRELFATADAYLQPGWVGLSIVEAMAYGLPICTFRRAADVLQCVEYDYINDNVNGILFESFEDSIQKITTTSKDKFKEMGEAARDMIKHEVTVEKMVSRGADLIPKVCP